MPTRLGGLVCLHQARVDFNAKAPAGVPTRCPAAQPSGPQSERASEPRGFAAHTQTHSLSLVHASFKKHC